MTFSYDGTTIQDFITSRLFLLHVGLSEARTSQELELVGDAAFLHRLPEQFTVCGASFWNASISLSCYILYMCVISALFMFAFRCLLLIVASEGAAAVIWLHWRWRLLVPDHSCCSFLPRAAWLGQKLQFKVPVAARKHWNSLPSSHITEKNRPLLLLLETFC